LRIFIEERIKNDPPTTNNEFVIDLILSLFIKRKLGSSRGQGLICYPKIHFWEKNFFFLFLIFHSLPTVLISITHVERKKISHFIFVGKLVRSIFIDWIVIQDFQRLLSRFFSERFKATTDYNVSVIWRSILSLKCFA